MLQLISRLLSEEALLQQLFEHAFPGVAPAPPADPFLEQVAALQVSVFDMFVCLKV